jgi:parallel beta-helix repeat protein
MRKQYLLCCCLLAALLIYQPLSLGVVPSPIIPPGACIIDGTILYVGGSGPGNYTLIQQAVDAAETGDMVFVYDDSSPYNEHLTIPTTITLQGENRTTTVIDGNNTGDLITIQADDTTIDGFTFVNCGDDWPRCTALRVHADHADLHHLTCQYTQTGVILTASQGSIITDCTILYNEVGILLENGSTSTLIADNTLQSSSFEYQIAVISCPNNTVEGNTITNTDDFGIYVYDSPRTRLQNNIITACEEGIVCVQSNSSEITGNKLSNNTVYGICLGTCTDLTVTDNTFTHDGLFLYQCHDNIITDNTVNGKPLLYLEDADNQQILGPAGQIILVNCSSSTIRDQTIQDVCIAVQCWDCTQCAVYNNILTSNLCAVYLSGCKRIEIIANTISESHWEIFLHPIDITDCKQVTITDNTITFTDELTTIYISNTDTVVFSRNQLHGQHNHAYNAVGFGYSKDVTITKNTLESGSIELAVCIKALVRDNTLQSGAIGLDSSRIVRVLKNDIHPKNGGIYLRSTILATLRDNTITNGTQAISLEECLVTQVISNSFIDCGDEQATFINSLRNTWLHNYWGSPLSHPKILHGTLNIIINDFPPRVITIPMINIDMIPKRVA